MRHLRLLNLVCSHRNMRVFLSKRWFLSHKNQALRFVGACVARVWRTLVRVSHACMWHLARSGVRQDMTCAHVKMKCEKWFNISYLLPPPLPWNRMLLLCIRMQSNVFVYNLIVYCHIWSCLVVCYSYVVVCTRMYWYVTRMLLVCTRLLPVFTRMLLVSAHVVF